MVMKDSLMSRQARTLTMAVMAGKTRTRTWT